MALTRMTWWTCGLVWVLLVACLPAPGGGGGGGGAGGGGGSTFSAGFTYVRRDDRNVYVADQSDYQTPAVLTTGGGVQTPVLSKDGQRIVFARKVGADSSIQLVPSGGGTVSTVMASTTLVKNLRTPVLSPDGTRVAFAYDEGTSAAIGLVNSDGSGFAKLVGGGSLGYSSPTFFADGGVVLAAAGTPGLAPSQIEKIDVSTGVTSNVTNTLGNEAMNISNRLVLSPDGKQAVFDGQVGSGVTRIFVIDLSTKLVKMVNDYVNEPGTNDSFPAWVDASTVSYSSDSGGNDNVYKISSAGASRKLLVPKAIEAAYGPSP